MRSAVGAQFSAALFRLNNTIRDPIAHSVRFELLMVSVAHQKQRVRRMYQRKPLLCQKKLKIKTNQREIAQRKWEENGTCSFWWHFSLFSFSEFSSWEILNENQFSCQHERRLRWQTLAPCPSSTTCSLLFSFVRFICDETHVSRWRIRYFSYCICLCQHQLPTDVIHDECTDNWNENEFMKQFNDSNGQRRSVVWMNANC